MISQYDWPDDLVWDTPFNPLETPSDVTVLGCFHGPLRCGLCEEPILPGDLYWTDNVLSTSPDNVAHPVCWAAESSEGADPYKYFGVKRSDF